MAGHLIRALGGIVMAGACLTAAACTSSSTTAGSGGTGQSPAGSGGSQVVQVPVKNGTVVVRKGRTVICVMKVVNGIGTCKVPASKIGIGTGQLSAGFSGPGYNGSGTTITYTVVQANTTTALALSAATVSHGVEPTEHLSVKITAIGGGTPTGSVAVKYQGLPVCTIKLSSAQGSCTLPANRIPVGAAVLTAIYAGDASFRGSVSATATLTVTR